MRRLYIALLVILAIASVTNGAPQELCATIGYLGLGFAAVWEIVRRERDAHRGE